MELRFDGTEWQNLGQNNLVKEMKISHYGGDVIPVPESFTTSQCACDGEDCWQEQQYN